MPIAVTLSSPTHPSRLGIERLWDRMSAFESSPSQRGLNYPPHLTFAIYDGVPLAEIETAVETSLSRQKALHLSFDRIGTFDVDDLVLWAAPSDATALLERHAALHALIDPGLCDPHYRPGAWVPHCTLATRIAADRINAAREFAGSALEPFSVLFDAADCVEVDGVELLRRRPLSLQSPLAGP